MFGRKHLNILFIIQNHFRKTFPLDQIYQMSGYIYNTFALLPHIKVPGRTYKGGSGYLLIEIMDTFKSNSRIFQGSFFEFSKNIRKPGKCFLQYIGDIITLRHDIV